MPAFYALQLPAYPGLRRSQVRFKPPWGKLTSAPYSGLCQVNKGNQNTRVVEEKPGPYDHPSDDEGPMEAFGEAPMEAGGEAPGAFDAHPVGSLPGTHSDDVTPGLPGGLSVLPDGWAEKSDPASGRKYYVNHLTKQTQWDRPCAPPPHTHTHRRWRRAWFVPLR